MSRVSYIARRVLFSKLLPFSGAESNYAQPLKKQYDYGVLENRVNECSKKLESRNNSIK